MQVNAGINSLIVSDNAEQWGFKGRERRAYLTQSCSTQPFQYSSYPWLISHWIVEQLQASWSKKDVYHVDTSVQILTLTLCHSSTWVLSLSPSVLGWWFCNASFPRPCVYLQKKLLSKWNIEVKKKAFLLIWQADKNIASIMLRDTNMHQVLFSNVCLVIVHILESIIGLRPPVSNHNESRNDDMFIPAH